MRVLIVHPSKGFYGGAEEVVVQLYNYLRANGHNPLVVAKSPPKEILALPSTYSTNWQSFWQCTQMALKAFDPDVVCCFNFPATLAIFPTGKPVVWYCNEPPELFTNWKRRPLEAFNRWWVRQHRMTCIVATAKDAERFEKLYGEIAHVVPYGVDYAFWSQSEPVKRSKSLVLLQVGHEELFHRGRQVLMDIRLGVPDASLIQLSGVSREEVRRAYRVSSILLHLVTSHGGWLVPFEAMCAGLPVVTLAEFAAAPLIREAGMLAAWPDDLVKTILSMWHHYPSFVDSSYATELVRDKLTWEEFCLSVTNVLWRVI